MNGIIRRVSKRWDNLVLKKIWEMKKLTGSIINYKDACDLVLKDLNAPNVSSNVCLSDIIN